MANMKIGLDYFAFDVDFFDNDKVEFLGARFGLRGEIRRAGEERVGE